MHTDSGAYFNVLLQTHASPDHFRSLSDSVCELKGPERL